MRCTRHPRDPLITLLQIFNMRAALAYVVHREQLHVAQSLAAHHGLHPSGQAPVVGMALAVYLVMTYVSYMLSDLSRTHFYARMMTT